MFLEEVYIYVSSLMASDLCGNIKKISLQYVGW